MLLLRLAAQSAGLDLRWVYSEIGLMSATIEQLTEDALGLSEQERAELAHRILVSLEEVIEEGVEGAWETEVAKRVERIRSGMAKGRPAEDVFRDIRARHQ
jgi:putative addiction module component (TIGR02574 family)